MGHLFSRSTKDYSGNTALLSSFPLSSPEKNAFCRLLSSFLGQRTDNLRKEGFPLASSPKVFILSWQEKHGSRWRRSGCIQSGSREWRTLLTCLLLCIWCSLRNTYPGWIFPTQITSYSIKSLRDMSSDFSLTPIKLTTMIDHHTLQIFKLFENSSNLLQAALKIKVKTFFFVLWNLRKQKQQVMQLAEPGFEVVSDGKDKDAKKKRKMLNTLFKYRCFHLKGRRRILAADYAVPGYTQQLKLNANPQWSPFPQLACVLALNIL